MIKTVIRYVFALFFLLCSHAVPAQSFTIDFDIPAPAVLVEGGTAVTFQAFGTPIGGSRIKFTSGVTWMSDNTAVLNFKDSSIGEATLGIHGTAKVTASVPNQNPISHPVTVGPPAAKPNLTSYTVDPLTVSLTAGKAVTLTVMGTYKDAAGNLSLMPVPASMILLSTPANTVPADPTTATVSGATITASSVAGPQSAKTTVTVQDPTLTTGFPPPTVTIAVSPISPVAAPAVAFAFHAGPTDQSTTIDVDANVGDTISLFQITGEVQTCSTIPPANAIALAFVTSSAGTASSVTIQAPVAPAGGPPFLLTLAKPLVKGSTLCALDVYKTPPVGAPAGQLVAKQVADAPPNPTRPKFVEDALAGASTLKLVANAGDAISVYGYLPGFPAKSPTVPTTDDPCSMGSISAAQDGLRLLGTFTASAADTSGNISVTLAQPLVAGFTLCVTEKGVGYSAAYSSSKIVRDFDNNWRARTYFIFGLQANNQLSSTGSTPTAAQYIEIGYNTEWISAKSKSDRVYDLIGRHGSPGLSTNIDVRFSPIPVSASQMSNPAAGSSGTPAVTPNALSSQQSVRAVQNLYFPWKTTADREGQNVLTIAPMGRAGFGTLINPTTPSTSTVVNSTQFNSAYYFWAVGGRLAWDNYPPDTAVNGKDNPRYGPAPQTMAEVLFTVGQYSNLPSLVCVPAGTTNPYPASTTVITACNQGAYAATTNADKSVNYFNYSRTLIPRVDIEAFFRPPNTPIVLGMEANLQQNAIFKKSNLDTLNKPGNDVRIFIGLTINLATLLAKFGSPTL